MSIPDFGHGSRATRRSRRVALGGAVLLIALILALAVYAALW